MFQSLSGGSQFQIFQPTTPYLFVLEKSIPLCNQLSYISDLINANPASKSRLNLLRRLDNSHNTKKKKGKTKTTRKNQEKPGTTRKI